MFYDTYDSLCLVVKAYSLGLAERGQRHCVLSLKWMCSYIIVLNSVTTVK
ncbi:hypothetical protein TSAR_015280 [Trichomalopsis sarcophagae]|uniref:Uncharacterized protein n=1 Tax=Trichomalopsis sarcophagae TaxID=543379 RepID=A0A232EPF5_9HYME|nr:hypothetical protein TSAR_015280 [Trichomalopsis sarcophagae]